MAFTSRWSVRLLCSLGFCIAFAGRSAAADAPMASKPIDLVLCLDTSNSMDGLINSAKAKLWDVVNELARLKPTPNLRVALYSYGNDNYPANIGWVRKDVDLTTDLDDVYKALNALKTRGGTEYVARVTKAAIEDLKWSKEEGALKIIFVCGNEPVDQDKQIHLKDVAVQAKRAGVIVNTIYCGPGNHAETPGWKAFAEDCAGSYLNIDQDKAKTQIAIKTEFDDEIIRLSGELNKTYVCYGKEGQERANNQHAQDRNAAAAAPEAAVARSVSKAGALYKNSTWDLVDCLKEKDFDLAKIKDEDLPEELRKLTPALRLEFLKKKAEERAALQKKVEELSASRQKKIDEALAAQPKSTADRALDEAVRGMVRTQAHAKGFTTDGK